MAKEYVERDMVLSHKWKVRSYDPSDPDPVTEVVSVSSIMRVPAADVVEARHGRWLSKEYMYGDPDVGVEDEWVERLAEHSDYYAYCSACGKDAEYNGEGSLVLSDYCPSCGAKMDGGQDDG